MEKIPDTLRSQPNLNSSTSISTFNSESRGRTTKRLRTVNSIARKSDDGISNDQGDLLQFDGWKAYQEKTPIDNTVAKWTSSSSNAMSLWNDEQKQETQHSDVTHASYETDDCPLDGSDKELQFKNTTSSADKLEFRRLRKEDNTKDSKQKWPTFVTIRHLWQLGFKRTPKKPPNKVEIFTQNFVNEMIMVTLQDFIEPRWQKSGVVLWRKTWDRRAAESKTWWRKERWIITSSIDEEYYQPSQCGWYEGKCWRLCYRRISNPKGRVKNDWFSYDGRKTQKLALISSILVAMTLQLNAVVNQ
jgi:hypothetical protein